MEEGQKAIDQRIDGLEQSLNRRIDNLRAVMNRLFNWLYILISAIIVPDGARVGPVIRMAVRRGASDNANAIDNCSTAILN